MEASLRTREKIVEVCKRLNQKNLLAAGDGNISVRLSDQEILITPSGVNKADIDPKDIAVLTLDGVILQGKPSSERLMHLEVYKNYPQAKAVVHAHPPTAIAWSIARPDLAELPSEHMSELILSVGSIPIVPYARPGTAQMAEMLRPYLAKSRVMILARHGGLCWGEDLSEAYNGMERLEHTAQILQIATTLGSLNPLPAAEIAVLRKMRQDLGPRTL